MKEYMIATGVVDNQCGVYLTSHLMGNSTEGRALARLTARKQLLNMKLPLLNGMSGVGFGHKDHYPRTVRVYKIQIVRTPSGTVSLNKSPVKMIWYVTLLSPWLCVYRNHQGRSVKAPKSWNMEQPRTTPTKETL